MVTVKPAALSTTALVANQISLTVSYSEQYRKPKCCNVRIPVQTTVTYSYGQTTFNGTTAFVPVIATINVVYTLKNGSTKVNTFVEMFDLAFQGQTEAPATVTITSLGRNSSISGNCCGNCYLALDDSITVLIA